MLRVKAPKCCEPHKQPRHAVLAISTAKRQSARLSHEQQEPEALHCRRTERAHLSAMALVVQMREYACRELGEGKRAPRYDSCKVANTRAPDMVPTEALRQWPSNPAHEHVLKVAEEKQPQGHEQNQKQHGTILQHSNQKEQKRKMPRKRKKKESRQLSKARAMISITFIAAFVMTITVLCPQVV